MAIIKNVLLLPENKFYNFFLGMRDNLFICILCDESNIKPENREQHIKDYHLINDEIPYKK